MGQGDNLDGSLEATMVVNGKSLGADEYWRHRVKLISARSYIYVLQNEKK